MHCQLLFGIGSNTIFLYLFSCFIWSIQSDMFSLSERFSLVGICNLRWSSFFTLLLVKVTIFSKCFVLSTRTSHQSFHLRTSIFFLFVLAIVSPFIFSITDFGLNFLFFLAVLKRWVFLSSRCQLVWHTNIPIIHKKDFLSVI